MAAFVVLSASFVLTPSQGHAVLWEVRSDTTAHVYRFLDAERQPIERLRFYESLQVFAMTGPERGAKGRIFARTFLRLQGDNAVVQSSEDWRNVIRPVRTDILGASLSGIGMIDGNLDFEMGRFMRLDSLGFAMLDGASVEYRLPANIGVGVHGGVEPTEMRDAITWNPFRLDGFAETRDEATVLMYGGSLFTHNLGLHSFRLDYREWRDTDDAMRARQVGASGRLALPSRAFVDADARYDLLGDVLADARGRIMVPLAEQWDVEARYTRVVPVFDTFSIFSVYPLYPLQEGSAGVRMRVSPETVINLRGSIRILEDARGPVYEPGGHLGVFAAKGNQSITVALDFFFGETGTWSLLWVEGSAPLVPSLVRNLSCQVGTAVAYVDDGYAPELNTLAYGGHVAIRYEMSKRWNVRLFVEDHESRLEKHALRVFLTLSSVLGSEDD